MFSFNPAQLGERLHALRRRRDQTLRELGTQADVNYVTLSKIERGKMPQVSADIVARLAVVLGVSTDYLLGVKTEADLPDATTPLTGDDARPVLDLPGATPAAVTPPAPPRKPATPPRATARRRTARPSRDEREG